MKKLVLVLLAVSMVAFVACQKDDAAAPAAGGGRHHRAAMA